MKQFSFFLLAAKLLNLGGRFRPLPGVANKMRIKSTNNIHSNRAFTLVDVMVGMGVLGVSLLSLFACFTFGFGVVRLSREELRATQILHETMETIRLYRWDQINQEGFIPTEFTEPLGTNDAPFFSGTITITNAACEEAYKTNLRQVIVSVSWTNNDVKCSRSISTFVSRYGLQNYILRF